MGWQGLGVAGVLWTLQVCIHKERGTRGPGRTSYPTAGSQLPHLAEPSAETTLQGGRGDTQAPCSLKQHFFGLNLLE